MAKKSGKPTLKPVVADIARLIRELEKIKAAVPAEKKALVLNVKRLKKLKKAAFAICRSKSLNIR